MNAITKTNSPYSSSEIVIGDIYERFQDFRPGHKFNYVGFARAIEKQLLLNIGCVDLTNAEGVPLSPAVLLNANTKIFLTSDT